MSKRNDRTHGVKKALRMSRGFGQIIAALGVLALAGCSGMVNDANTIASSGVALQGSVHGGQQPVIGATIQLYAAQATGYGAASVPLIASTVVTDSSGAFTITNKYTCPASPNDQVYLVATGGNPGAGINANLAEMAALGPCGALTPATNININEVTTAASAFALSGFMTDYKHVSSSATNSVGLVNAFATVNNLINTSTGTALTTTPAYNTAPAGTTAASFKSVVPQAELNTLGNILATCVNTNGVGGSSLLCSQLFTATKPSGGTAPSDTIQAVLNIALSPGQNVGTLYNMINAAAPFSPALTAQPNDFTVAINYIGGGLGGPGVPLVQDSASSDLAIDATGNIWISNYRSNSVTKLNNLGAPLSPSTVLVPSVTTGGYQGGGLSNPNAIALDTNSVAWVANSNASLSEFANNGSAVGAGFTGGGLTGTAKGLALDGNNNIWITGSSAIAEFNNSGTAISGTGYTGGVNVPTGAIAIDSVEDAWIVNGGDGTVSRLNPAGSLVYNSTATLTSASAYASIDPNNQFIVPQGSPNSNVDIFNANQKVVTTTYTPASGANSVSTSIDGAGNIFVVNAGSSNGPAANVTVLSSTGGVLSTAGTGYQGSGNSLITSPRGSGLDMSGNLWIANGINVSTVTEFIGIGSPTIAPLAVAVKNAKIGTRP